MKRFVEWCNKSAYCESGDVHFYCGMCDENSGVKEMYRIYLKDIEKRIRTKRN